LSAFELSQKFGRCGGVVDVAGSEQEAERAADYIGEGVDFGGVSAARRADLLRLGPPFCAERRALDFDIGGTDGDTIGGCTGFRQRIEYSGPEPLARPAAKSDNYRPPFPSIDRPGVPINVRPPLPIINRPPIPR
jgi:hypothetical protein